MRNRIVVLSSAAVGLTMVLAACNEMVSDQGRALGFAAVPGQKGGQDIFGPYDVVEGWPQNLADLPGHDAWTYGAGQSVFAESPDRIYMLHRG